MQVLYSKNYNIMRTVGFLMLLAAEAQLGISMDWHARNQKQTRAVRNHQGSQHKARRSPDGRTTLLDVGVGAPWQQCCICMCACHAGSLT